MTSVKLINHSSSTADWNKLYVAITRARYSVAILYDYNDNVNICGITKYK